MRCVIGIVIDNRYRYYISAGIYTDDIRNALIFPNSQAARLVANAINGIIIPVDSM